jgi:hypothetical protein
MDDGDIRKGFARLGGILLRIILSNTPILVAIRTAVHIVRKICILLPLVIPHRVIALVQVLRSMYQDSVLQS